MFNSDLYHLILKVYSGVMNHKVKRNYVTSWIWPHLSCRSITLYMVQCNYKCNSKIAQFLLAFLTAHFKFSYCPDCSNSQVWSKSLQRSMYIPLPLLQWNSNFTLQEKESGGGSQSLYGKLEKLLWMAW